MGRLTLILYVLAVFTSVYPTSARAKNEAQPQKCIKLLERKEWRTLTREEKAEWVGAVKVRAPSSLGLVCMLLYM